MKWLSNLLFWLWQFPQNILAFIISGVLGPLCQYRGKYMGKNKIYSGYIASSFSLGDYIFVDQEMIPDAVLQHEFGHCCQSRILGWLYIPVIVIPSLVHNFIYNIAYQFGKEWDYYHFYTEKWANDLAKKYLDL